MTRRLLISASILALTAGCSSSSSSGNPVTGTDSGTTGEQDSSTIDTGTTGDDGGTVDTGTVNPQDTGVVNNGDGSSGDDAGSCTALASVAAATYTNVTAKSACLGTQISDFLTACSSTAQPGACNTWFTTAANVTCGECISPAADSGAGENSGALLVDSAGLAYINTPGCLQIKDGNSNCAAPLEELWLCEDDACDSVACQNASQADQQTCQTAADSLACMSQVTAINAATQCTTDSADGGTLDICNPQTTAGLVGVIATICDQNGM